MPIPLVVGRLNRLGWNRIATPLAPHVPGFGVVVHHGRRSGNAYRTPVNLFRTDTGYVIALTYGPEADWVKNVLAEGGCTLLTNGRAVRCAKPEVYVDRVGTHLPLPVRAALRTIRVDQFMALQTVWSQAAGLPEA